MRVWILSNTMFVWPTLAYPQTVQPFCTAQLRTQHTDTQTMLRVTSLAEAASRHSIRAMQPNTDSLSQTLNAFHKFHENPSTEFWRCRRRRYKHVQFLYSRQSTGRQPTDHDTDGDGIDVDQCVFVERRIQRLLEIVWLENVATVTVVQEPALIQLHRPICSSSNTPAVGFCEMFSSAW